MVLEVVKLLSQVEDKACNDGCVKESFSDEKIRTNASS